MAVSTTPRFGVETYSAGTDPHPGRTKFNERMLAFEALAAIATQGATGSRPSAGKGRAFYWDTTVDRLYFDNGTAWKEVTTNGAGGPGAAIVPGAAAVEGTSSRSARADHTHSLPLATAAVNGAMAAADKAKLDAASAAPTPNTLVMLDANGRTQVAAPSAGGDTTNKTYVDAQVATRATTAHSHAAADISSGVLAAARLPASTSAAAGSMSAADKAKLDAASAAATPSTLVLLDGNGRAAVANPSLAGEIANKGYVDTQVATRATTAHTHAWADITSGVPTTFTPAAHVHAAADVSSGVFAAARLPAATGAAQGAMSAADKTKLDGATALATPSTLVMLDAAGRAAVAAPSGGGDIANKTYVDGQVATKANTTHTHTWGQITGAPATYAPSAHTHDWFDLTGVPTASRTQSGVMSASAYALLYDATAAYATSNIVMRDANGNIEINRPVQDIDGANKLYVDDQMNAAKAGKLDVSVFTAAISTSASARAIRSPNLGSYMTFYDNGVVESPAIYNTNAASGSGFRAVWVNNTGGLGYNLSSEKFKTNIQPYEVPLEVLDKIEPKRFQYKENVAEMGEDAPFRVNFIAEDLHDAGLTEYVSYDENGTERENCQTINESLMVNALWSFAQQQQSQIKAMQNQLNEMAK
ncbi:minor tail protein [Arthrobacter phage Chocolat]|uniref:Minor tail protein n=5 Tax=Klausavirus princesstrina TaxID=1984784 RepID=A0A286N440_9CAUD|nr:minor tail protein [Arthrobacter phage Chocolat]APC44822.1 minor tail protein [Arthrobacter phage HumptyDumpty]ASX98812.1 minor tail protein [Arthrobacter phage Kabreeze]ASX99147.1 minor tail protein [Arthrobacter phage Tophat]QEQ94133.1 minor tail protein [Arthrobacter phage Mordred]